jgi:hypothetical protein
MTICFFTALILCCAVRAHLVRPDGIDQPRAESA